VGAVAALKLAAARWEVTRGKWERQRSGLFW
jgi:hypothetical protein